MDRVTTNEALEILRGRGFKVSYPTVARWAQAGAFEGAERIEETRGPVWLIPRASVLKFEPPKTGRPPKPETDGGTSTGGAKAGRKAISRWENEGGATPKAAKKGGKK